MKSSSGGWNFNYTTRDIVIIAVIAAIAGVINTGVGNIWYLANTSLGPMGGALLQGSFMWAYILVMWLVRKPGAAIFLGLIETAVEVLLGNASGIGTLGWGLTQGLGVEIVMAISQYKNYSIWAAMAAGAAASQFGTTWTAVLFGWDPATAKRSLDGHPDQPDLWTGSQRAVGFYLAKGLAKRAYPLRLRTPGLMARCKRESIHFAEEWFR